MLEINASGPESWLSLILFVFLCITPIAAVIWLFAWMREIRDDAKKIKSVLKKRFPEEFADEEDYFPNREKQTETKKSAL